MADRIECSVFRGGFAGPVPSMRRTPDDTHDKVILEQGRREAYTAMAGQVYPRRVQAGYG